MLAITQQEIFDISAKHLLKQNGKSFDAASGGGCTYRNPDGKMCAVGVLISDSEYTADMEGWDVGISTALPRRLWPHLCLLGDLQSIHDLYEVEEWRKELQKLANKLKISSKVLFEEKP